MQWGAVMRLMLHLVVNLAITLLTGGVALAVPAPAPSAPTTSVDIAPGERIELEFAPNGALTVLSREPASAEEAAGVPKLNNDYEQLGQVPVQQHSQAGRLTILLAQSAADGTRLLVTNGYGEPIIYQAALITDRNGTRSVQPTSVCPVRAGGAGIESWSQAVVGLSLSGFEKVDDAHMSCNNGSLMSQSNAGASADRFVCVGGADKGAFSPLTVRLVVDANGAIGFESASWTLSTTDVMHSPLSSFEYAMEGDRVANAPTALRCHGWRFRSCRARRDDS
jgi:hypothetical protein